MSELFELGDEASDLALGVAAAEVIASELAIELAGGMCQQAQMIE